MGVISVMDYINESSFGRVNSALRETISTIDGQTVPVDAISLSVSSLYYDTYGIAHGDDWVQVYSSGGWTAAVFEDTYGILDWFTTGGVNGDPLQVAVFTNTVIADCHGATIRVTRGTEHVDLTIFQDGTVLTC